MEDENYIMVTLLVDITHATEDSPVELYVDYQHTTTRAVRAAKKRLQVKYKAAMAAVAAEKLAVEG